MAKGRKGRKGRKLGCNKACKLMKKFSKACAGQTKGKFRVCMKKKWAAARR